MYAYTLNMLIYMNEYNKLFQAQRKRILEVFKSWTYYAKNWSVVQTFTFLPTVVVVHTHPHIHTYTYTRRHTHTHTHTHTHIYIYIYKRYAFNKFPDFFEQAFKIVADSWKFSMFLSGIRDVRSLWGIMRGVGVVRKSMHHSKLAKGLELLW